MIILFKSRGSEAKAVSSQPVDGLTFDRIIGQSDGLLSWVEVARNFEQKYGAEPLLFKTSILNMRFVQK